MYLYKYIDWIASGETIISNDSLGMHLGIALGKKIIGLFGPTSSSEVYFYGKGIALKPNHNLQCIPCMNPKCNLYDSSCMNLIDLIEISYYKKP